MAKLDTKMRCMYCNEASILEADLTAEQVQRVINWMHTPRTTRPLIQHALPFLTADQRELLLSGTHSACFDTMFPEEEE